MKRCLWLRKDTLLGLAWLSMANAALCLFVFREATWGQSLLAPLDIVPACFSQYHFVDPASTGLLKANAQFDQVVYDLPLQHGIYQAYRRGEIPWWDPYGFGGRPLLADAHINGTDPIRLLAYAILPFELAYNWTLIGHFIGSGLTMFCLLRFWQFRTWICVFLALTFEFAGCQTFFFGFPWLQGALLYYPLLWLAWDAAMRTGKSVWLGLASLAIAGIFYSGNLQSHAYVVVFAAAFAVGYAGFSWKEWRKVFPILALCGICGACLAAPVLLNQIEFFVSGVRGVKAAMSPRVYFTGLACLTSIFPWMLGDFRTFDARSAFFKSLGFGQNYGLGFHTFIGSAGLVLAILGSYARFAAPQDARIRRTGLVLALFFLGIVSSPLIAVFYTRSSGLFVLAAIALSALGLQALSESSEKHKVAGRCVIVGAMMIAVGTNVGALVIYPRVLPKVRQVLQEHETTAAPGAIFKMPPGYRDFQIANLPNEISFKNPETILALVSLLWVGGILLLPARRSNSLALPLLLALNLAPAVLFCERFVPRQPLLLWNRLLAGGPEQQNAIRTLAPNHLRLRETAFLRNDYIFPDAMEHLYRVHTVHGYSALVPASLQGLGLATRPEYRPEVADYTVVNGELQRNDGPGLARFRWVTPINRDLRVEENSLNEIRLQMSPGPGGVLLWTDTRYAGWRGTVDGKPLKLRPSPPCFTELEIPADAHTVRLKYRPRFLPAALVLASIGVIGLGLTFLAPMFRKTQAPVTT